MKDDATKIIKLETDLKAAEVQIQELTIAAKQALADLQNYRKKSEEDKANFVAFANASLILELLPILDNFNRAFLQVPENIRETEWFKGTLQIEQQLVGIMRKNGVTEMPSAKGQKLDLSMHEAIMVCPGEKDTVVEELEKGYMIGEKVLRPAKVKVGDGTDQK